MFVLNEMGDGQCVVKIIPQAYHLNQTRKEFII